MQYTDAGVYFNMQLPKSVIVARRVGVNMASVRVVKIMRKRIVRTLITSQIFFTLLGGSFEWFRLSRNSSTEFWRNTHKDASPQLVVIFICVQCPHSLWKMKYAHTFIMDSCGLPACHALPPNDWLNYFYYYFYHSLMTQVPTGWENANVKELPLVWLQTVVKLMESSEIKTFTFIFQIKQKYTN